MHKAFPLTYLLTLLRAPVTSNWLFENRACYLGGHKFYLSLSYS